MHGAGRGECEKKIHNEFTMLHNLQAFYSVSDNSDLMKNVPTLSRRNQVSLALFLSADIHQGDEVFSVHSTDKHARCFYEFISASYSPKYPILIHCPHCRLQHLIMS